MSTFKAEIVPVELLPHPNADKLSIVKVFDFTVCVRTEDWQGTHSDRGIYIPVDAVVDTLNPRFMFLADRADTHGFHRVKAMKLRGVFSMGFLIPCDPHYHYGSVGNPGGLVVIGDWHAGGPDPVSLDLTAHLGITKYEPPLQVANGDDAPPPPGPMAPEYTEIESLRRYPHILQPGEEVVVTEKIHGANLRITVREHEVPATSDPVLGDFPAGTQKVIHVGSRSRWIECPDEGKVPVWWLAIGVPADNPTGAQKTSPIVDLATAFSPSIFYGEVYGKVEDLRYGLPEGVAVRVFDAFDPVAGAYWDYDRLWRAAGLFGVEMAPLLYRGPYDQGLIASLSEDDSQVAPGQLMEGLVIRPVEERWNEETGRVILKHHSQRYLLRKGA